MSEGRQRHVGVVGLMFVLLTALVGCAPHFVVLRDGGTPSPLRGVGPISVSFDYSKLYISGKTEAEFVQERAVAEPDYPRKWSELKGAFESNLISGFSDTWPGVTQGPPGPGGHLTVFPTALTMGKYMLVAATSTSVTGTMAFAVNGQDADAIEVRGAQSASIYQPSVFQHMPGVATSMGRQVGSFVKFKNQ